jgi:hypothetical protein
MPAAANPAAAGGSMDPNSMRSPSAAAAAAAHAHLALPNGMVQSGQLPPSPLPQQKLLMPNSADKLADTGKVRIGFILNDMIFDGFFSSNGH